MRFNTKLLHGKGIRKYPDGATIPPISQVTAFQYDTVEEQELVFAHKASGFAYSRIGNPTVAALEQRMNDIEGGNAAVAASSGMAAVTLTMLNLLCAGDEIIAGSNLYGGTIDLLEDLEKFDIRTRYVRHLTVEEIREQITDKTRVIFGEVIGNPGLSVMDIPAVSELAHSHGIPLVVDSTTATPYLINPLELGADIVIHSTSKYINGSGNSIGGVIIDGARFQWDFERQRSLNGYRTFGKLAFMVRLRTDIWENAGGCLSPNNAFLTLVGLETLGLRMERICDNAQKLAEALAGIGVDVHYPTLPESPYRDLAMKYLKGMGGGILTFRAGTKERAFRILNELQYVTRASNLGDVRTLAIHPASTLYVRRTQEQKEAAGVYEDTIRVSVGIEDAADLIEDFLLAFHNSEL